MPRTCQIMCLIQRSTFRSSFSKNPFLPRFWVSVHLYTCVWLKIRSLGYCRTEALERGNGDGDGGTPPHTSGGFVDLGAKLTRTTTAPSRYTKRTKLLGLIHEMQSGIAGMCTGICGEDCHLT